MGWISAWAQEPSVPTAPFAASQFLPAFDEPAPPVADQRPPPVAPRQTTAVPVPQTASSATGWCIQPAPMVRIEDYQGPMRKIVGTFVGRFERATATVHQANQPPHYKPGMILCTLDLKDKFVLFVEDSIDPGTFLGAAFNAGLDQAENANPSYGQGAQGYGRRFGAELAGQATSRFFLDFAYPSIFREDPRYYRLGSGALKGRLLHAVEHSVVAHRDSGGVMFNFSEWLGTTSSVVVANTYEPDNRRGFAPAARRVGYAVANDIAFDVLREFWPEISHTFKLPFRGEPSSVLKPTAPVR